MTEGQHVTELARGLIVREADHVLQLLYSECDHERTLGDLLLALVGWDYTDLLRQGVPALSSLHDHV